MIAEKKKTKSDPIKTIGLNVTPIAREIVIQIANALGLKIRYDRDEEENIIGVSTYAGNCLRLSDHCTYMQTWVDAGTWKAPYRYDIVIEDDATFAKQQVQEGFDFSITEYVAKAKNMDVEKAKMIAYDIRNCINTGIYANNIGAEKRMLNSNHETDESLIQQPMSVNSNKEAEQPQITDNKTNKNMKQNTIKLNESQLRKIVAESVKNILSELDWHLNESSLSIDTIEDLCRWVGCSIDNQQEAQLKIEQLLIYLHHCGVIENFNEDKLDWLFSDEQSY